MVDFTRTDLIRFERLAIRGWPARETADIGGWLWRSTGGGSIRANAVSTLTFHGNDVALAIDEAEARYRAAGEPARFVISDVVAPADLDQCLAARDYMIVEPCTTLAKRIGSAQSMPGGVELSDTPGAGWYDVYLAGVNDNRRPVAMSIVARVPAPRVFLSLVRDGNVISTGLGVLDGDVCSVQCMSTRADARRQGGARTILSALESWAAARRARTLFLQADASNTAALATYASAGFTPAGRYHVRFKNTGRV